MEEKYTKGEKIIIIFLVIGIIAGLLYMVVNTAMEETDMEKDKIMRFEHVGAVVEKVNDTGIIVSFDENASYVVKVIGIELNETEVTITKRTYDKNMAIYIGSIEDMEIWIEIENLRDEIKEKKLWKEGIP